MFAYKLVVNRVGNMYTSYTTETLAVDKNRYFLQSCQPVSEQLLTC